MNGRIHEKADCLHRHFHSCTARVFAVAGLCRTVPTRGKAIDGCIFYAWSKCKRQWRSESGPEGDGNSRMDIAGHSWHGSTRASRPSTSGDDSARFKARLQPVCLHPVSYGLQSIQVGCQTRLLFHSGLDGQRRSTCQAADRDTAGNMATCQKIKNGIPTTERSPTRLFRHGTKSAARVGEKADFVPPRNKSAIFSKNFVSPRVTFLDKPSVGGFYGL